MISDDLSDDAASPDAVSLPADDDPLSTQFLQVINVASLDGTDGFAIYGMNAGDFAGWSVSSVQNMNGSGLSDILIGAPYATPGARTAHAGEVYVVYGSDGGFSSNFDLSTLNGTNGFVIDGSFAGGHFGYASSSGDINGDGYSDVVIGAPNANVGAAKLAGAAYVVYGANGSFPASFSVTALNGVNGFSMLGAPAGSHAGWSVATGDINGDGYSDVIVGAPFAGPGGLSDAGSVYVVFGQSSGMPASVNLGALNGTNGFEVDGLQAGERAGLSVTAADINGDGYADLIIGAPNEGSLGPSTGAVYVVYGHSGAFPATINLSSLDGTNGFVIEGAAAGTRTGWSVATADLNGDGIPDIIISEADGSPNGVYHAGITYVIYGSKTGFPPVINLANLTPSQGFEIEGYRFDDEALSVSAAGDINGDGIQDIIIGSPHGDPTANQFPGYAYVVFGQAGGFSGPIDLASLNGVNGFRIDDNAAGARFGFSVSGAGDLNGDGFDDLIVGARYQTANGQYQSGAAYVIYGHATSGPPLVPAGETFTGTSGNDVFSGNGGADIFNMAQGGSDIVFAGGGNCAIYFGSYFNAKDAIDGGSGQSTLYLDGDYSRGVVFNQTTVINMAAIELSTGFSYKFVPDYNTVLAGQTMTVDGSQLGAGNSLTFVGTQVRGNLVLEGGAGNDTFHGGFGDDTMSGGGGSNFFTVGTGIDTIDATGDTRDMFIFPSIADSTGSNYDTIIAFDAKIDHFEVPVSVTGVDAEITSGSLSTANFNAGLSAAIGPSQLAANHAVLFTPTSGTLAGDTFLIIDANGTAGYQPGGDFVIELTGAAHLANLTKSDFLFHG